MYQFQAITINGQDFTVFYDSGCGDFISRYDAIKRLDNIFQQIPGPIQIGGVGITAESKHGIYTVKLPLFNGQEVELTGLCLDRITSQFPKYPIVGEVGNDIITAYKYVGGNPKDLPKLQSWCGGEVDFMIGIKYLRYHPEKVFQLPSGLTIYRSVLENSGGRGVIVGPHEVFTETEKHLQLGHNFNSSLLNNHCQLYMMTQHNHPTGLLGFKDTSYMDLHEHCKQNSESFLSNRIKLFEKFESTGSEITYRCIKCRSCKTCKECEQYENRSITEEIEQDLISQAIIVDISNRLCTVRLPFIYDPIAKLSANRHKAMKVYRQQIVNKCIKDKEAVHHQNVQLCCPE